MGALSWLVQPPKRGHLGMKPPLKSKYRQVPVYLPKNVVNEGGRLKRRPPYSYRKLIVLYFLIF